MMASDGEVSGSHSNLAATKIPSSKRTLPNPATDSRESQNPNDPLTLPPGFSSDRYHKFLSAARRIVGEQDVMVLTDTAQLTQEHYTDPSKAHDMHNIVEKTYFVASAVLSPREVPEVQDIMRLCNEFEMPVWPFSIGRKYAFPLEF